MIRLYIPIIIQVIRDIIIILYNCIYINIELILLGLLRVYFSNCINFIKKNNKVLKRYCYKLCRFQGAINISKYNYRK